MNLHAFFFTQHQNKDIDKDNTLLYEVGLQTMGIKFFYFIFVNFCAYLLIYT